MISFSKIATLCLALGISCNSFCATSAKKVLRQGDNKEQVLNVLGMPTGSAKLGEREILFFKEGKVILVNGLLSEFKPKPKAAVTPVRPAVVRPVVKKAPLEKLGQPSESEDKPDEEDVEEEEFDPAKVPFKSVHSGNSSYNVYLIGNVHSRRNVERDYKLLEHLVKTGKIEAIFLEGLDIRENGHSYSRYVYKKIFFYEPLAEICKDKKVKVYGSQTDEQYKQGKQAMTGMALLEAVIEYEVKLEEIKSYEESGDTEDLPMSSDEFERKFGDTINEYRRKLKNYNINAVDMETMKKVYGRAPKFFMREREKVAFDALRDVMRKGHDGVAVLWGKAHMDNFIKEFKKYNCNLYIAQKKDLEIKKDEDVFVPEEVKTIIDSLEEMNGE